MYYPSDGKRLRATIQAPFVLAEIRAIRSSVFKSSPEVQRSVALAEKVERAYDLTRADLFIPALETYCALLEPFDGTLLTDGGRLNIKRAEFARSEGQKGGEFFTPRSVVKLMTEIIEPTLCLFPKHHLISLL